MPISASRTSKGFTILEVLVVISIMAVLTGLVVVGFTGADQEQRERGFAELMQQRLELARQQALQRNKTWGFVLETDSYQFAEYDIDSQIWVAQPQRPFGVVALDPALRVNIEVEGETLISGAQETEEGIEPDVLLFASGETTPFTLELVNRQRDVSWELSSDGFSTTELERGDPL